MTGLQALVIATTACEEVIGPPSASTVTVTPESVVMVIGTTITFTAEVRDSAGNV